jgi:cob(I)alamin adenosyltransferase
MFSPTLFIHRIPIVRTTLHRHSNDILLKQTTQRRQLSCPPQKSVPIARKQLPTISAMDAQNDITDIEELHRRAIHEKQSTYIDPTTGFTVFTELAHLKRARCCGNMCRHCPYGYCNVKGVEARNAIAESGNREETGRLVKMIMDGTYYDNGVRCRQPEDTTIKISNTTMNGTQRQTEAVRGKGGYAGGTLTNKNVPYTRKGDTGTSQLFTGERRSKDDAIFEAMGTVDELCCIVGTVHAELAKNDAKSDATTSNDPKSSTQTYGELPDQLLDVMSRLFDIGSHIARPSKSTDDKKSVFPSHHCDILEEWIDTMTEQLPELTSFILPTGSPASSSLHVARTVCRRAERRMVPLFREFECCDENALAYVNRLSDYLFSAARFVNYCDGKEEVQYRRESGVKGGDVAGRERVVVRLKD